eukprot:6190290-Pleurochrysis_carterae.AAC.1
MAVPAPAAEVGGVCANAVSTFRAIDFTYLKEGGAKLPRVVGVLLGKPGDIIAGVPLFAEHHLSSVVSFEKASGREAATNTRNRAKRAAATASTLTSIPDRR